MLPSAFTLAVSTVPVTDLSIVNPVNGNSLALTGSFVSPVSSSVLSNLYFTPSTVLYVFPATSVSPVKHFR